MLGSLCACFPGPLESYLYCCAYCVGKEGPGKGVAVSSMEGCGVMTALFHLFPQDFLRKEFSEENILFWQACECFSHVPAHDKKEVTCSSEQGAMWGSGGTGLTSNSA